jgi:hypothetical protein
MRVKGVILYAKLVDSGCVMLLSVESFVVVHQNIVRIMWGSSLTLANLSHEHLHDCM